ncbi:MAG: tetratricopeptide repeat protein [Roseivirga sp.]|nr:tetratricopeptide repeat protein [Roseivirga sp.]
MKHLTSTFDKINYSPVLFIILFFLCHYTQAQTPVIDSLRAQLSIVNTQEEQASLFNELAYEYFVEDLDSSLFYAESSSVLSKKIANRKLLSTAYTRISDVKAELRDYEIARVYLDSSLILEKELKDTLGMARATTRIASMYRSQNKWEEALKYGREASQTYANSKNPKNYATALTTLANTFGDMAEFDSSVFYHQKSLAINRENGFQSGIALSLLNLGNLHWQMKNPELSLEYSRESLQIYESLGWSSSIAKVLTNLGNAFFDLDAFDEAERVHTRSLKIRQSNPQLEKYLPLNYNNLGNIAFAREDWKKARQFHTQAYELRKEEESNLTYLSEINLGNVERMTGNYSQATDYYENSLAKIEQLGLQHRHPEVLLWLSASHGYLRNTALATEYLNRYNKLSFEIDLKISNANNLERRLKAERSSRILEQNEAEKQQAINDKQNTVIYSLIAGIFLIILLFFTIFRISQLRNKNLASKQLESLQKERIQQLIKEKELEAINAMVEGQENERLRIARDLHDRLGGTLSIVKMHFKSVEESIEDLKDKNISQYKEANNLLDEACDEVRKIAHDMASGVLMKFGLVAALNALKETVETAGQLKMNLIDIGLEERLSYNYEINVYRIIQELLTNTLKHAKATEMSVQLFRKESSLSIVVEDNGQGFEPENQDSAKGIGLKNIEGRVYKFDGEVNIDSGKGAGTTITIDLPLNEEVL